MIHSGFESVKQTNAVVVVEVDLFLVVARFKTTWA
jgi:hypothetical protein